MRKYLSLAAMVLSSGGVLVAGAGAANAATIGDSAAPWLGASPLAAHGAPWGDHGSEGLCAMQRDGSKVGKIDTDLVQKLCAGKSGEDMAPPPGEPVPGPPPVMTPPPVGSPEPPPCTETCVPKRHHHHHPKPPEQPCPPPVMPPPPVTPPCPPPVMPPPPVTQPCPPPVTHPCPPPPPNPCPPGDHGWAATPDAAPQTTDAPAAPAGGNAVGGLPIVGSALGGLL